MTLGEKLKEERNQTGLSQEKLAEKLNISRSAVAKWERDKGIPDVVNLKSLAHLFNVSIDYLLAEEGDTVLETLPMKKPEKIYITETKDKVEKLPEYEGYLCSMELTGWNDGVSNGIILGQDSDFIYYKRIEKRKSFLGMLGKKYITAIKKDKAYKTEAHSEFINKFYFVNKHVQLEMALKEGLLKGFLDFSNDDYRDVIIKEFTEKEVRIAFGKILPTTNITKIEELSS